MKIRNIIFVLLAVLIFSACSDDTHPRIDVDGTITFNPIGIDEVIFTKDNVEEKALTLSWTAVDVTVDINERYAIQIDKADGDFSNAPLFGEAEGLTVDVKGKDINTILIKTFKQEPETSADYKLRIVRAAKNIGGTLIHIKGGESEPQPISFTAVQLVPENIYMIGNDPFGNWEWNSDGVVELIPVHGREGEFWVVKYLTVDNRFKFSPVKDWKGDFAKLDENTGFVIKDNNAAVETDGLYMIYINYPENKIVIEPAKISGMLDCFGGAGEGDIFFDVVGDKATITTTSAGELRMSAYSSAKTSDWWTREFIILEGKIVYRGTGNDQERVNVAAGKVITLDFNANTGTIE